MPIKDLGTFQGRLGEYQVIETEDGSRTLRSPYFNEACHSLNGAFAETIHNYIRPNKIEEFSSDKHNEELNILEVGFGLGIGVQATYDSILTLENNSKKLNYTALEIDEALIEYARQSIQLADGPFPTFSDLKRYEDDSLIYYRAEKNQSYLTILVGDAREALPEFIRKGLCPTFHVIYQDPFSPKKNPSLWTYEWFKLLASTSRPMASLSTYCASVSPRKALLKAGFRPKKLKGMGFKREITQALLDPSQAQDTLLEKNLLKSKAITLTDENVKNY